MKILLLIGTKNRVAYRFTIALKRPVDLKSPEIIKIGIMLIETTIGIGTKILQSIGAKYVMDEAKRIYALRHRISATSRYKKSLEATLSQMPFIYKDIDLEVLEDYVDIEVQFIDTKNLRPLTILNSKSPLEKLNQNFKALFIGSAGMGKSTFFRYSALSIIKGRKPYFLATLRNQTPIFISLKAVPNFGKSPIITSILEDVSFLREGGVKKLINLTQKGKVFFLLDGYDEISFTTSKNHIRYELGLLMSTNFDSGFNRDSIDEKFVEVYQNITQCTVWLSTREEFYRLNPIGINSLNSEQLLINPRDFIGVQLRGLGDNRLVLVKKIFDKYRMRSKKFKDLLDEEVFIEEIDTHSDEELVRLSKRPLFLTILCYIHATFRIDNEDSTNQWLPYLNELILECIKVLLSDLDKFKVRGYTTEQKKIAFVRRRSDYLLEKTEFLKYFALEMLLDGNNVFDFALLERHVLTYFTNYSAFEKGSAILAEFSDPKSNNPNFAVQLIFSGIFVVVNSNPDHLLYDFPHRRFKEVLATEGLNDDRLFKYFLTKIEHPSLSEFILIAFKCHKSKQDEIVSKLAEGWNEPTREKYNTQLILNILNQNPKYKIDKYVIAYLDKAITQNHYINIYWDLLQKISSSFPVISILLQKNIVDLLSSTKLHSVSTTMELAEIVDFDFFTQLINGQKQDGFGEEIRTIFRKFQIRFDLSSIQSIANYEIKLDLISLVALAFINNKHFNDSFYTSLFNKLPLGKVISLWYLLITYNSVFINQSKSSIFILYKLLYDRFLDSRSLTGFKKLTNQTLKNDIAVLDAAIISLKKEPIIDNNKLSAIKAELDRLNSMSLKVRNFSEEDWNETLSEQAVLEGRNFEYLKDRVDRHEFYYTSEID